MRSTPEDSRRSRDSVPGRAARIPDAGSPATVPRSFQPAPGSWNQRACAGPAPRVRPDGAAFPSRPRAAVPGRACCSTEMRKAAMPVRIGRPAAPLPRLVFPYRRGTGNWARRASKRWPVRVLPRRNRPAFARRPRSLTALRFPGKSPDAGKPGSPDSTRSAVRTQPCNGH